jgi:hypothetical protein
MLFRAEENTLKMSSLCVSPSPLTQHLLLLIAKLDDLRIGGQLLSECCAKESYSLPYLIRS